MRIPSGKPKLLKSGETGWLHLREAHAFTKPLPPKPKPKEKTADEWRLMLDKFCHETPQSHYEAEAKRLGVPAWAMGDHGLAAGYSIKHGAWAYAMWDGQGGVIGIRLRSTDGKKWAVPGSHSGIFIPNMNPHPTMVVVEGPTDTMAGISLGYYTVGRPSCAGGAFQLKELIQRCRIQRVLIIADNDKDDFEHPERPNPGINGAKALAELMVVPTAIVCLPSKDLRELVNKGEAREVLDWTMRQSIWRRWHHA